MITPVSYEKIKSDYRLEFVDLTKTSSFGGLPIFIHFLERSNFRSRLAEILGDAAAKGLLQIMLGSLMGARSMEDVALLSKDRVIKGFIKAPLSATRIPRVLRKVAKSQIQHLHELTLSNALLDMTASTDKEYFQTLDFDATADLMYGRQEGVAYGYVDKDQIKKCYQYQIIRNDALNTIVYGTVRDGSAHSQNDFCGYLSMILPLFSGTWALRVRADSGYFNENAFDICHVNNIYFFIKAPMSLTRKSFATSGLLKWRPDPDEPSIEYATFQTKTAKGNPWQEIFKRERALDKPDGFRYACLASNDFRAEPRAAFNFYNKRANIENINSELKGDLGLGSIVTKWFDVNDIITQGIIILYQLLSHFKRTCLDKADRGKRAATLSEELFKVPAEIMRSSRREWLRVYTRGYDGLTFARIFARIEALSNVFVLAFQLRSG